MREYYTYYKVKKKFRIIHFRKYINRKLIYTYIKYIINAYYDQFFPAFLTKYNLLYTSIS